MTSRLTAVVYDVPDPAAAARFWARLLDREVWSEPGGELLPGTPSQVGLRFAVADGPKREPVRMHLHLTSDTPADQQRIVADALATGGSHIDVGQLPGEGHIVLADPGSNEWCVIEAGNSFLAGCGPLGEVACDGSRQVGVFWSKALGWPLVWDQDEETAIQAPEGGTKVAWGGPPQAPKLGRNHQRFELSSTDPVAEADRLVELGATLLITPGSDGLELADPDGNEFVLTTR